MVESVGQTVRSVRVHSGEGEHDESLRLKEVLRALIHERGVSYAALAGKMSLSVATVKRILHTGELSTDRAAQMAEELGLSLFELVEYARNGCATQGALAEAQEEFLAENLGAFRYLHELTRGRNPGEIEKEHGIDRGRTLHLLSQLAGEGLLQYDANTLQVIIRSPRPLRWRASGPLQLRLGRILREQGLGAALERRERLGDGGGTKRLFTILSLSLDEDGYRRLLADMESLVQRALLRSKYSKARGTSQESIDVTTFLVADTFDLLSVSLPPLAESC